MFHSFIRAALLGRNDLWRYLVSIIIIGVSAMVVGAIPALLVFGFSDDPQAAAQMDFAGAGISEWLGLTVMLLPFVVGVIATWLCVRGFHGRNIWTTIHPKGKVRWNRVLIAAFIWLLLMLAIELEAYRINPDNYIWTFDAARFFPVLIVVILLIPLQIAFEELLFRGYLMQGLGIAFRYPIIPLLLTSVAFGALHLQNPEIAEHGNWLVWSYIQIGLLLGLVTLLDEGLEMALGIHAMNNIYAALFVTFPSSALSTPALYTMKTFDPEMMYIYSTVAEVLFIIIGVIFFKWRDWSKLFRKVSLQKTNLNYKNEEIEEHDDILDATL